MKASGACLALALYAATPVAALGKTADGGEWLKGDLHIHSRHSEDSSNHPLSTILNVAREEGIDFLLISDHDNHVAGAVADHTWADPEFRSDSIIMLYGAEWTTDRGHANPISAVPYDHQRLYDMRDARDMDLLALKEDLGIHLSVNHPRNKDSWSMSFDLADSLEVWNSTLWDHNEAALLVWDDLMRSGRMLTGRGGSDSHHGQVPGAGMSNPRAQEASANNVGTPTTWVLAQSRTAEGVVAALDNGHVSISVNPYAPRVEFTADRDGDGAADMIMGDNETATGEEVVFTVSLVGSLDTSAGYTVKVVKDGAEFRSFNLPLGENSLTFTDAPAAQKRSFYRVEVRGPVPAYPQFPYSHLVSGPMVALSNPVYFNFDPDF